MAPSPPPGPSSTSAPANIPRKRTRIAIACLRCKSRKQKCSGEQPICLNCANSGANCEYNLSASPAHSRIQYQRAVQHIEELKARLQQAGVTDDARAKARLDTVDTPSTQIITPKRMREESGSTPAPMGLLHDESKSTASTGSFVDVLRNLSLEAAGGYVNSSSNITMAHILDSLVTAKEGTMSAGVDDLSQLLSPKSNDLPVPEPSDLALGDIPKAVAERELYGYFRHCFTLWPILPISFIRRIHVDRSRLEDRFEIAALHLVYGIGGRYLETTGETGNFCSEGHYAAASTHLDHVLQLNDIRSVQILLLFAIYSLRAPRGPGAWTFIGMAMRTAIELGLHRRSRHSSDGTRAEELRRCVFWGCYCLDRQISIILGRPFAISDRDIDVELPTGGEFLSDGKLATKEVPLQEGSTQIFRHICRLRMIESRIQQAVYRVDVHSTPVSDLDNFIVELESWKCSIPFDAQIAESTSIHAADYYMVYYYKCLRFLLHPHVSSSAPLLHYLEKCTEACGGICQVYKRLHQNIAVGFSLMALHSVFFAGLTLLYCSWVSPKQIFNMKNGSHLNACSIVLHIIAERWPGAKKYRDLFESLKETVMQAIEEGQYEPRLAIKRLKPDVQQALRTMQNTEANQDAFATMLAEMAGEMPEQAMQQGHEDAALSMPVLDQGTFGLSTQHSDFTGSESAEVMEEDWYDLTLQTLNSTDPEAFSWLLSDW